jgi:hypothetical protein
MNFGHDRPARSTVILGNCSYCDESFCIKVPVGLLYVFSPRCWSLRFVVNVESENIPLGCKPNKNLNQYEVPSSLA